MQTFPTICTFLPSINIRTDALTVPESFVALSSKREAFTQNLPFTAPEKFPVDLASGRI